MDVVDLTHQSDSNRENNPLLSNNIKGVILGQSGCGKTNLSLNLLTNPGWLDYNKLIVYGKSLHQPEYQVLQKGFERKIPKKVIKNVLANIQDVLQFDFDNLLDEVAKGGKREDDIDAEFHEDGDQVCDPRELNPVNKNLIIFDDLLLEKQNACNQYYSRGRQQCRLFLHVTKFLCTT